MALSHRGFSFKALIVPDRAGGVSLCSLPNWSLVDGENRPSHPAPARDRAEAEWRRGTVSLRLFRGGFRRSSNGLVLRGKTLAARVRWYVGDETRSAKTYRVGRATDCEIRVPQPDVSRVQFVLVWRKSAWHMRVRSTTNPVILKGQAQKAGALVKLELDQGWTSVRFSTLSPRTRITGFSSWGRRGGLKSEVSCRRPHHWGADARGRKDFGPLLHSSFFPTARSDLSCACADSWA